MNNLYGQMILRQIVMVKVMIAFVILKRLSDLLAQGTPSCSTQSYGYDAAGRQISTTDALGHTTTKVYDSLGRVIQSIDPMGNATSFGYDFAGNQISQTDADNETTTFVYDANNRQVQTILPEGQATTITYDGAGRKVAETDAAGKATQFSYDAKGNLIAVVDALNNTTQYEYDANGNRTAIIDANGNRTTFAYDLANRMTSKTMPNGGVETYTYDAAGRQITKTDALNHTINYAYDTRGRLTTKTYPDNTKAQFTYTLTGKRLTAVDQRGTTSYDYDSRNRMTQMTYPDGQAISYTYTQNGHLHTISSLAGTIDYIYNCCRLKEVHDPQGHVTTITYDPAGNRTGLAYPNGTAVAYTYDTNNRLTQIIHTNSISQILASYTYTLGPTGNRTRIDESNGIVRQYEYDDVYRLTKEQVADPENIETYTSDYTYDAVGNRLSKTHTITGPIDYTYNNADELLMENGVTYTYDLNGNLATKVGATGTTTYVYDYDNRLTSVTAPAGTVTYKYDVDGNRVETSTGSGTVQYLVDTNRQLPQVLAEYASGGVLIASYVYADDLISMTKNGQTYYYHFDGLGSTRMLSDSTGTVTDLYDYDAFGNLIAGAGTTVNPFLFTGQQYDANSGFYYLRARYYQPTTGRFTALDPIEGDPYAPISLHKYLYAAGDPVNKIDPSGEQFDLGSMMVAMSINDILSTIATPSYAGILRKFERNASLTFYSNEDRIVYREYGGSVMAYYEARNDVANWCTENGKKYKPTKIEIGYKSEDVKPRWIDKDRRYGDGWTYIDTFHPRGKDIHGGGRCKNVLFPFIGRQGWCPTCGCIRMQNEDIRELSWMIKTFQKTNGKVPFEVK